ncbi:hypothetical protein CYMTET_43854 [Cymbomonas tetramitiformis]|uniref:Uncharacterized protein n=1 Tax=Cymbomonas tetramitiformis TaxID=36881 RepID=A0AAE0C1B1_9CHLO|nr:hypothetical protein CYMTET_43854 [Cymbomonas tetramitiformis]
MSKKNNLSTRVRYHNFDKEREAAAEKKKVAKAKKTIEKKRTKSMAGTSKPKLKNGIKIKRKVAIRGIKIRTAEDKERVKDILKQEKQGKMQM